MSEEVRELNLVNQELEKQKGARALQEELKAL